MIPEQRFLIIMEVWSWVSERSGVHHRRRIPRPYCYERNVTYIDGND